MIVAFGLCSTVACLLVAVGTVVVIERKYRRGRGPVGSKSDEDGDGEDEEGAWFGRTDEDGYYDEEGNWIDNRQEDEEAELLVNSEGKPRISDGEMEK